MHLYFLLFDIVMLIQVFLYTVLYTFPSGINPQLVPIPFAMMMPHCVLDDKCANQGRSQGLNPQTYVL